jgi:hypothetical protein
MLTHEIAVHLCGYAIDHPPPPFRVERLPVDVGNGWFRYVQLFSIPPACTPEVLHEKVSAAADRIVERLRRERDEFGSAAVASDALATSGSGGDVRFDVWYIEPERFPISIAVDERDDGYNVRISFLLADKNFSEIGCTAGESEA